MTRSRAALAAVALWLGAACGGRASGGAAAGDLRYLPATAKIVASVDVRALRAAPTFGPYEAMLLREVEGGLNQVQAWCNLDVRSLLGRVTLALTPVAGKPDAADAVAVVHGLPRAKVLACVDDVARRAGGALMRRGEAVTFGEIGAIAQFIDDTTAVVVVRADQRLDEAALANAIAGRGGLPGNADLAALIDHLDSSGTAWAVGDLAVLPDMPSVATDLIGGSLWAGVTVRAGSSAAAAIRLRTNDTGTADAVKGLLLMASGKARSHLARFDVRTVGTGVFVDIEATAAQIPNVIEAFDR